MGVAFTLGLVGILFILFIILCQVFLIGLILFIIGIVKYRKYKRMQIPKKFPKIFIIVGSVLMIVPAVLIIKPRLEPSYDEMVEKDMSQVIECFENRDEDKLEDLFTKDKQSERNLGKKITKAFDFIEGDIISYEKVEAKRSGGGSNEECIYDYYSGGYDNIETSSGKIYRIVISSYLRHGDKDNSGVIEITVVDITNEDSLGSDTEEPKTVIR